MAFIFHDEFQWPWTVYDMIRVAVHQRGRTARPYEKRACRTLSAQSGGTIREDQQYLPERGGMQQERPTSSRRERHLDPRSAMIGWAVQKASEHVQEVHPNTLTMLCRAETRTTHALMKPRSASQTQHISQAAFRRASLNYPLASRTSEDLSHPTNPGDEAAQSPTTMVEVLQAIHPRQKPFHTTPWS